MRELKSLQAGSIMAVALVYTIAITSLVTNAAPSLSTDVSPKEPVAIISQTIPLTDSLPTKEVSATDGSDPQQNAVAISTGIEENSPTRRVTTNGDTQVADAHSVASNGVILTGLQYTDGMYNVNTTAQEMNVFITAPTVTKRAVQQSYASTTTEAESDKYNIRNLLDITPEQAELGLIQALSGKGEYLLQVQEESQVSVAYIAAVARGETTMGKKGCLSGQYNLFNIRRYDGSYKDYGSYEESVQDFVDLMNDRYLNPEDSYHRGFTVRAVGKVYAQAPRWSTKIEEYVDMFTIQVSEEVNSTEAEDSQQAG